MPELNYGPTFKESNVDQIEPQSWENDVLPPFQKIRTLLNTTLLDTDNVQTNGLRSTNMRNHADLEAVRIKVRNSTGSPIAKGDLLYFNGTYNDGTYDYPTVTPAIATALAATNYFAQAVATEAISNNSDGTVAIFYELKGQNTGSATVGDPVYLGTSAGTYTLTKPTSEFVQVVGTVTVVNASTGRIIFFALGTPQELGALGSLATQDANAVAITGGSVTGITDITVADGGTGASDAATARTNLGLVIGTDVAAAGANTDITSLSGVTLDATSVLADGVTATTQSANDNSTKVATTAYTDTAVGSISLTGIRDLSAYINGGTLKIEVAAGTTWTLGFWQSSDGRWWLLGNTAEVDTFARADAEFYIPLGDIADVPTS